MKNLKNVALAVAAFALMYSGLTGLYGRFSQLAEPDESTAPADMSLDELRRAFWQECFREEPPESGPELCPDEARAYYECILEHGGCLGGGQCEPLQDLRKECSRCRIVNETGGGKLWKRCDPFRKYDRPG